ncbi:MAG: hypothetical protein IPN38_15600 [Flavobacteriales bacterium]|nr:hypothetical protein [Flavobacteriales bacterium]
MYLFTIHQRHLLKHTVEVLEHLQEEGLIIVEHLDGKPARKGSFYINYKDYKGTKQGAKHVKIRKA